MDVAALRLLVMALAGWWADQRHETVADLVDEHRILRARLRGRVRLTDAERRRLAVRGHRLGRRRLCQVATIVTPDTILRWHRRLIARKWTDARRRPSRRGVLREIRRLVRRMAEEHPTWGYSRVQGALKKVGRRVGRSTSARILKAHGIPPVPERPTSWQTFLRAPWGAIAGADVLTTEVWTWRGRVTYSTIFVIDRASRRGQVIGSTPHPDDACMTQVSRTRTAADEGVVQTPSQAPNAQASAERFVRSIKPAWLNRVIPLGDRPLRRTIAEFVTHDHCERTHPGLGHDRLDGAAPVEAGPPIRRRQRLGGILNFYARAA